MTPRASSWTTMSTLARRAVTAGGVAPALTSVGSGSTAYFLGSPRSGLIPLIASPPACRGAPGLKERVPLEWRQPPASPQPFPLGRQVPCPALVRGQPPQRTGRRRALHLPGPGAGQLHLRARERARAAGVRRGGHRVQPARGGRAHVRAELRPGAPGRARSADARTARHEAPAPSTATGLRGTRSRAGLNRG